MIIFHRTQGGDKVSLSCDMDIDRQTFIETKLDVVHYLGRKEIRGHKTMSWRCKSNLILNGLAP